jgi:putative membrane protein
MMWWYGPAAGGWGMTMAAVTTVLVWLLVAAAVAVLVHHLARRDGRPTAHPRTAEELLAERFARGELDEPEYRARLDVLRERHLDRAG